MKRVDVAQQEIKRGRRRNKKEMKMMMMKKREVLAERKAGIVQKGSDKRKERNV